MVHIDHRAINFNLYQVFSCDRKETDEVGTRMDEIKVRQPCDNSLSLYSILLSLASSTYVQGTLHVEYI